MVLNMTDDTARVVLALVDHAAGVLMRRVDTEAGDKLASTVENLQHLGIVKHRLHYGLGLEPFSGPGAWGHPLRRR